MEMNKKTWLVLLLPLLAFFAHAGEEKPGGIDKELIKKFQVFMELDRASLPKNDPRRKNERGYFFVKKLPRTFMIKEENCEGRYKIVPGEYQVFEIVNEINTVGAVERSVVVSPNKEIFWIRADSSLKELFVRTERSIAAGGYAVPFLFNGDLSQILETFANSEGVKFLYEYKPRKEDVEDYIKKLHSFTLITTD